MDERAARLRAELQEARLLVSDLTRTINESAHAEEDGDMQADLDRAHAKVLALEEALAELEAE